MSATLLIANPGKKGARKFVLRQPARRAPRRAPRKNTWKEPARTGPTRMKHRAAAYVGHGMTPAAAKARARRANPGEYRAAFNRLKADMAKATRKTVAAAKAAREASARTNPHSSKKSVAQRLAALKARLGTARKNPTVRAKARKEKKMATKKRRSAAQKAATRKMLAANKRMRGNPGKKRKSSKRRRKNPVDNFVALLAKKRKSSKRRRKNPLSFKTGPGVETKRKGGKKKGRKSIKARRPSKAQRRLKAHYKRAGTTLAKLKGVRGKKASRRRAVARGRRAGVRARLSGVSTATLRKYGLTRVNPSPMGILKDVGALLPELGVAALAFLGVAVAASPANIAKLPDFIKNLWKKDGVETDSAKYVPLVGGVAVAVAAYLGVRMYPKTSKWAAPVAFGGMGGAMLYALSAISFKQSDAAKAADKDHAERITLGKRLGLPLGEYVSVAGYVDVGGGRMMSVNGLGEYVSVAGIHSMNTGGGSSMRYEGSMGEYVLDPVGLSGGIFPSGSLGELVDNTSSQVPLRRDPMWGLRGDPEGNVNVRRLLGQGDVAGVGGGIFDRNR